jgi:hypothetical protein
MTCGLRRAAGLLAVTAAWGAAAAGAQPVPASDPLLTVIARLEQVLRSGEPEAYVSLLSERADYTRARAFAATEVLEGVTRAVARERARTEFTDANVGAGVRLLVDTMVEFGDRARIATWHLYLVPAPDNWRIIDQERLGSMESLHRLVLTSTHQYEAHDFTIRAEGLDLTLERGSVFTVDIDQGTTGVVLLGQGAMRFHPAPETEQGQIRILTGSDVLETRFDSAFVRFGSFATQADRTGLVERPVDRRELRRAETIFREESLKSFTIDLGDLSSDGWSFLPGTSDLVAEVRTRRHGTLTYTRSESMAEDISLVDRTRQKQISVYMSADRLAARGPHYNEDDLAEYDVRHYGLDLTFWPDRRVIEGRATLQITLRTDVSQLVFRLADSLAVHTVDSDPFGPLFSMRVKGQNLVVVNLPALVLRDTDVTVTIAYQGRVDPQPPDREMLQRTPRRPPELEFIPEVRDETYLLSNRTYWYPQAAVSDYATASIRVTLPEGFDAVASGVRDATAADRAASSAAQHTATYIAARPIRYLALFVGRITRIQRATVAVASQTLPLILDVYASRSQAAQAQDLDERAAEIVRFFQSLIGDVPYPSLALATITGELPGGHSPGYFTVMSQPPPESPRFWRSDPGAFDNRPDFFLAHEIAHQWWGQAVGWRNYHEQWLSEGFAQYFAALYLRHRRGENDFDEVMREMRRWAVDQSYQGPISLGYRLGGIRNDRRAFRAVVYNKGAAVLDMLRLLAGDEAFFAGLRKFYEASRFTKVGTEDFREAMEAATGRPLERFFESWVYGTGVPRVRTSHRIEASASGPQLVFRAEHLGEPVDLPLSVTVRYTDGSSVRLIVPMTAPVTETELPLKGTVRAVDLEKHANMVVIVRD